MDSQNPHKVNFLINFLLGVGVLILILISAFLFKYLNNDKRTFKTTKTNHSIRGNIYSKDGYTLATSEKLYKVSINPRNIDPDKQELFINLLSIYSQIPQETIRKKLSSKGYTTLSYDISAITSANLKLLNGKLDRYGVFQEFEENGRVIQKMGLDVEISGHSRKYPYGNTMEPLLGYTQKTHDRKITKTSGMGGSERSGNQYLEPKSDEILEGFRDVGRNIIRNKVSHQQEKQDGYDLTLTIPLKLQTKIETILDEANHKLGAQEILVGIMDSKSGEILSLATSRRFNPKAIEKKDYPALNVSATTLSFEPGSIIKPIIYATLLEKNLIDRDKSIFLHNGIYQIGRHTIRDDYPLKDATPREILIKSSNIGMIKLTQDLDEKAFLESLSGYGFGQKTHIDLPNEADGILPSLQKLKGSYQASVSYGYGFRATFIQLLRAYASFSNGGYLVTPKIIDSITRDHSSRDIAPIPPIQVISREHATEIEEILRDIVKKGTGRRAFIEGVDMGGKTGTARIFIDGQYTKRYNSSFFGFAQDFDHSYTIGIVIFDPNVEEGYYGSKTAAPIFKEIVELLLKEKYLTYTKK